MKTTLRIGTIALAAAFFMHGCSTPPGGTTNDNTNTSTNTNTNDNSTPDNPNAQVCADSNLCCTDDNFCDVAQCAVADADCANCGADGTCVIGCEDSSGSLDPDCSNQDICDRTEFCCADDGNCDEQCVETDSDCAACEMDGMCVVSGCTPIDPDCTNEDICTADEFCCDETFGMPDNDGPICDVDRCPAADDDCSGCVMDGACVALCSPPDPDCSNSDICDQAGFCCDDTTATDDNFCDVSECPTTDGTCDMCVADGTCVAGCENTASGDDPDCN
jgi:hypothetical protein